MRRRHYQILFYGFLTLVFLMPWPLGLNRPWLWLPAAAWALLLLAFTPWLDSWQRRRLKALRWPIACLGLWIAYHLFQLAPLTDGRPISVDRYATAMAIFQSIFYATLFFLALLLPRGRRAQRAVLVAIVLSAVLQGSYGSLMTLSGIEWGLLTPKQTGVGVATGTFVNPNHLAGCLEIGLAAGIGLMIGFVGQSRTAAGARAQVTRILSWLAGPGLMLRLSLVVLVIALILTRSRTGNIAFMVSFLVIAMIAWTTNPSARRTLGWLIASLLVIDLALLGMWFGVDEVVDRIGTMATVREATGMSELGIRVNVNAETLTAIWDSPWLGFGGGTYYTVFPAYKSADLRWYYDHAHNDYLELWLEYGLVGLTLLALFLACVLKGIFKRLRSTSRNAKAAAFAALMAVLSLLLHGVADFNLQIPSNAGWLMVLLGLAFAGRQRSAVPESDASRERRVKRHAQGQC